MPVCIHINMISRKARMRARQAAAKAGGRQLYGEGKGRAGAKAAAGLSGVFATVPSTVGQLIFTGVFDRFPDLHICMVEIGVGWLPHFLEAMDDRYWRNRGWADLELERPPASYWFSNMSGTFVRDDYALRNRQEIGVENMMWSTDYPHHGNDWPYSRKVINETMAGLPPGREAPDRVRERRAHLRARRLATSKGVLMKIEDMILVSVDDHVVEPPDLFEGHLAPKYMERAPRVITKDDGTDVWLYEGQELPNIGLNAVSGRPPEEYGIEPTAFSEMRPGCYDIDQRVDDMNANGVLGSMCFPSFPQFCGQLFARSEDKELGLALLRAYNDWHIDEWCGAAPGRFIPLALPVLWDPQLAADEVRRVAAKGCHAVTFSENPEKLGYPSFHSDYWDPFFAACEDEGIILCLHIGSSSELVITSIEAPINVMITLQPMNIVQAAADVLWSRVLQKFPNLRLALSEGGIGWIPYFLERVDYVYKNHSTWTGQKMDMLPSELFKERIVTCFIDDAVGVETRAAPQPRHDHVGVRLPALGLDVARVARAARQDTRRCARRRDRQDDAPERDADLPVRPVRRSPTRAVHGRVHCAPRPPAST